MTDVSIDELMARIGELQEKFDAANARVVELERLLAPPAPDAGVLTINYSDGRIKYAARDGNKYSIASDAQHRNKVLGLMLMGITEAQAETLLGHDDDALRKLLSSS